MNEKVQAQAILNLTEAGQDTECERCGGRPGDPSCGKTIHETLDAAYAQAKGTVAIELLREVIGDDDPRTYEEEWQWEETLTHDGGKPYDDHDQVEIIVNAGTIRDILKLVREKEAK